MEFNLAVFCIAVGLVIIAAVVASVATVVSVAGSFSQKNIDEEE